jgi:hypothetical protein
METCTVVCKYIACQRASKATVLFVPNTEKMSNKGCVDTLIMYMYIEMPQYDDVLLQVVISFIVHTVSAAVEVVFFFFD